jgi:hypothetical protein
MQRTHERTGKRLPHTDEADSIEIKQMRIFQSYPRKCGTKVEELTVLVLEFRLSGQVDVAGCTCDVHVRVIFVVLRFRLSGHMNGERVHGVVHDGVGGWVTAVWLAPFPTAIFWQWLQTDRNVGLATGVAMTMVNNNSIG